MSHLLIGLSLALVGSVALNASYLIQHAGSVAAPAIAVRHPMRTLGALLQSRPWLVGGVLGIVTAPIVVASTLVVFATGIILLIAGPSGRGQYLFLHKASFVIWLAVTAVHVLGHLVDLRRSLVPKHELSGLARSSPGAAGRWLALAGALVAGLVLAIVLIPQFAAWTANAAFLHHH